MRGMISDDLVANRFLLIGCGGTRKSRHRPEEPHKDYGAAPVVDVECNATAAQS